MIQHRNRNARANFLARSYKSKGLALFLLGLGNSVVNADPTTFTNLPSSLQFLNTSQYNNVFTDDFENWSLNSNYWHRERLLASKNLHQKPGVSVYQSLGYNDIDGRRDASFSHKYEDKTGYNWYLNNAPHDPNDGILIQRGLIERQPQGGGFAIIDSDRDLPYYNPLIGIDSNRTPNANFGEFRLYTSFLTSFSYIDDNNRNLRPLTLSNGEYIKFGPGTFFEIDVSFENMTMDGHRHSFWLMPARIDPNDSDMAGQDLIPSGTQGGGSVNANYDGEPVNGLEIDIYEREYYSLDAAKNNAVFMKAINGGSVNDPNQGSCVSNPQAIANGSTINELPGSTSYGSWTLQDAQIENTTHIEIGPDFPTGEISSGYKKIGFYYGESELAWFVDGYLVNLDTCLVPSTDMYLIVSREMNSGVGKTLLQAQNENTPGVLEPQDPAYVIEPEVLIDGGLWGGPLASSQNLNELGITTLASDGSIVSEDHGLDGRDYVAVKSIKVWDVDSGSSGGGGIDPAVITSAQAYSSSAGEIQWTRSPQDDFTNIRYDIERFDSQGNLDGTFSASASSWYMTGLTECEIYSFDLVAVEISTGNQSVAVSDSFQTTGTNCNPPPPSPVNFRHSRYSDSMIELFWGYVYDSQGTLIDDYIIQRDGVQLYRGSSGAFLVSDMVAGIDYQFTAIAVDQSGTQSLPSTITVNTAINN